MVQRQGTLGLRALPFGYLQLILNVHFGQEKYLVLPLFNVTLHLSFQRTTLGREVARFQRACKGASHSRADRGDDMIDSGGELFCDRRLIPRLDTTVHTGANRSRKWSTKACLTVGCSGTMRTLERWMMSPTVDSPCWGIHADSHQR